MLAFGKDLFLALYYLFYSRLNKGLLVDYHNIWLSFLSKSLSIYSHRPPLGGSPNRKNLAKNFTEMFGRISLWPSTIMRPISPLIEIFEGILMAAPKRKTTHKQKRNRMKLKWLKPMKNIQKCPYCGSEKYMHHLCRKCLTALRL